MKKVCRQNFPLDNLALMCYTNYRKKKGNRKMTEWEILASFMEYFAKKECEKNGTCEQCYDRCNNCLLYLAQLISDKGKEEK